ncbi:MAG: hypothetical protein R6W82_08010 [bacterium]
MNGEGEVLWWIGGGLLALLLLGYGLIRRERQRPAGSAFEEPEEEGPDDIEEVL